MKTYYLTGKITILILAILLISIPSCKKDDNNVDCAVGFSIGGVVANEVSALSDAAVAYSSDPSKENCDRYVDALRDYFNALKSYEKCATEAGQLAEFQAAVADAEKDLDDFECQ